MSHTTVAETPTITAGAYSALDAVGGKMEFEDVRTAFDKAERPFILSSV